MLTNQDHEDLKEVAASVRPGHLFLDAGTAQNALLDMAHGVLAELEQQGEIFPLELFHEAVTALWNEVYKPRALRAC